MVRQVLLNKKVNITKIVLFIDIGHVSLNILFCIISSPLNPGPIKTIEIIRIYLIHDYGL